MLFSDYMKYSTINSPNPPHSRISVMEFYQGVTERIRKGDREDKRHPEPPYMCWVVQISHPSAVGTIHVL